MEKMDQFPEEYSNLDLSTMFVAGYDSPMTFTGRHNEIAFKVIE